MDNKIILKWLLLIGGILELVIGVVFFFIDGFILTVFGLSTLSIFTHMSGIFFICFGILLIQTSKEIEKYLVIILVNILFRVMMLGPVIYNMTIFPQFIPILIFMLIYDPAWTVIVLVLLYKEELLKRI
jgi:hypothetical protein